jgi:hypothetical protein
MKRPDTLCLACGLALLVAAPSSCGDAGEPRAHAYAYDNRGDDSLSPDGSEAADASAPNPDAGREFAAAGGHADADVGVNAAGARQALPGAVYEVPVSAELAPYARYPVRGVRFDVTAEAAELRYPIPEELVGTEQRLQFRGAWSVAEQAYVLSGPSGDARCTMGADGAVECVERLVVRIELDKVIERFGASHPRVEVTRRFSADPIGILHFRLAR